MNVKEQGLTLLEKGSLKEFRDHIDDYLEKSSWDSVLTLLKELCDATKNEKDYVCRLFDLSNFTGRIDREKFMSAIKDKIPLPVGLFEKAIGSFKDYEIDKQAARKDGRI